MFNLMAVFLISLGGTTAPALLPVERAQDSLVASIGLRWLMQKFCCDHCLAFVNDGMANGYQLDTRKLTY
jgi:hypothetical protein